MHENFKQSRVTLVLALLVGTAVAGCTPDVECVEAPVGRVVSDDASGKVDAEPLPRCKTDWARPIAGVAMDSGDDMRSRENVGPTPTNPVHGSKVGPTPTNTPLGSDEISTADTSRADGDGDGESRQSGASIPTGQNMGASSSSQSATQRTEAVAQSGATVSASAIENGEGVSISRNPNGGFSVSFTSTDD